MHNGEGKKLGRLWPEQKGRFGKWGRRSLYHQEESTECVCNPKSDSKKRGHHPGQKKGMRRPQVISRVSLNWLTEPQGQGVRVFARSLGTWHLK